MCIVAVLARSRSSTSNPSRPGKAEIEVDEIGSLVGRHAQTLVTVVADHDRVAVCHQAQPVHLGGGDVVLDQQDLDVILHSVLLSGRWSPLPLDDLNLSIRYGSRQTVDELDCAS